MTEQHVLLSKNETGIAIITLHRPKAANAFSVQLLNELKDFLEDITYDPAVRCVIVTGSGEKVFCAGADLKERATMNEVEVKKNGIAYS